MIGYARCSTVEQAESGLGIAAQVAAVEAAVAQHGWNLVEVIKDEGASGKDLNRDGFRRALEMIARGDADGIVAARLDRISRSLVHVVSLLDWFARANATLVALDVGLDTGSSGGRLVAGVIATVGQWERETIAARTKDALAVKRNRGEVVSRPSVRTSDPGIACRIASERAAGATWAAIADGLNRDGVPTIRGGTHWRVSSVQTAGGYQRPPREVLPPELPRLRRRRAAANRPR
jgi:DNA invertase Pin-like site-specific DNA recombinase